ncbi:MAG: hypothetical protein K8T91_22505 [Planctomycetes bacterium]|nr:hypothetical protein [Planctomycetota bacterium]
MEKNPYNWPKVSENPKLTQRRWHSISVRGVLFGFMAIVLVMVVVSLGDLLICKLLFEMP